MLSILNIENCKPLHRSEHRPLLTTLATFHMLFSSPKNNFYPDVHENYFFFSFTTDTCIPKHYSFACFLFCISQLSFYLQNSFSPLFSSFSLGLLMYQIHFPVISCNVNFIDCIYGITYFLSFIFSVNWWLDHHGIKNFLLLFNKSTTDKSNGPEDICNIKERLKNRWQYM